MKKTLIVTLIINTILIVACGGQSPQPLLESATVTEIVTLPTQPPTNTYTPINTPTSTHTPSPATESPATIPNASISFINEVYPIFEKHCNKCHGVEEIKEGLDMRTYETLMTGSFNGTVITPGNADDSFLVQQIIEGEMPKRGPKLTLEQIQIIINWVNQGAVNN